jgi:chromate transporter
MLQPSAPVSLFAIYRLFFWVGMFSFGGGLTAWFHREVVMVRQWMTDEEFFSGYSLAQVLPGVNSTNMAVYIGQRVRGAIGSAVALTALLTAPLILVICAGIAYDWLVGLPGFSAAMAGIATVAAGMIFRLGLASAKDSWRRIPSLIALIATFVAVAIFHIPIIVVVLMIAPLSTAAALWRRRNETAKVGTSDG